jgi:hypothetical protein
MTNDTLPPHLERIGRQLTAAAHELSSTPRRSRRRTFRLAALSTTALTATAATIVLAVGATTGAAPAYALTHNADGSITLSLYDLTTGIPALNARLKQMRINETVIPVTPNCSTPGLIAGPGSMSETVTISPGNANLDPGFDGFLAAEQLPDGSIAIGIGETRPPLPACFSPKAFTVVGSHP